MRIPKVIYNGKPENNSWCRWIVNRIMNRNNSTNIRFVGDTGSGKSWSSLAIGEICAKMMNKKFDGDDIYFSVVDILDKIGNKDPPPGTIFFLDEQQIAASNKDHASKRNRAYSALMSTIRSKRYIFISTLPFSDMADKQVRRLFHVEIETLGVDLGKSQVITKPRYLEFSRSRDKVYRKRLLVCYKNKEGITKAIKLDIWNIHKPSQDLIDVYELKKKVFQQHLYKSLANQLKKYENYEEEKEGGIGSKTKAVAGDMVISSLTSYQKAMYDVMNEGLKVRKDINKRLIELGYHSSPAKISQNMNWMRRKGVVIFR